MSIYLTCEGLVDFPVPGCERLAYQVRVMTRRGYPVSTERLASHYGQTIPVLEQALQRTARIGWVRAVPGGWMAGEVHYYDDHLAFPSRGE